MSGQTFFIRCRPCEEMWVPDVNLMTKEPLWKRPKPSRLCTHPIEKAEAWTGHRWELTES